MVTNEQTSSETINNNPVFAKIERWINQGEYGRHSDYQIQHFIAGKEALNEYGGYKQMLREIDTRYTNMKNDMFELKLLEVKNKKLDNKIKIATREKDNLELKTIPNADIRKEELDLNIEEYDLLKAKNYNKIKALENQLMKNLKELDRFYKLAIHFEDRVNEKIEKGQSIQDQETEYWERRMEMYGYLSMCGVTSSLMDSVLALPKNSRDKVLAYMNNAQQNLSKGILMAPEYLDDSETMLSGDDVLAIHAGEEKKDFYTFKLTSGKEYVESMISALEEKSSLNNDNE